MIVGKMKNVADDYVEKEVTGAVITVPIYYNHAQRVIHPDFTHASSADFDEAAMRAAGTMVGLDFIHVVNDSFAAAYAYGLDKYDDTERGPEYYLEREPERLILVYHLGGSTFGIHGALINHWSLTRRRFDHFCC
jgi:heat shock protein 5